MDVAGPAALVRLRRPPSALGAMEAPLGSHGRSSPASMMQVRPRLSESIGWEAFHGD
jgi:hypothetical protein